ncbi:MAG: transcription antitermination factor NusB [Phycisphaerales bacterium]
MSARSGSARERVHRLLAKQIKKFPDLEIAELDTTGLDARDAALAHHIYDTVLRRWLTITHLLSMSLEVPWEDMNPKVGAPLMAAVAQMVFMDKVPVHAAVDEAVQAAKLAGQRSAGLANAVLRGLLRQLGATQGEVEDPDTHGEPREQSLHDARPYEKRATWGAGWNEVPADDGGALGFRRDVLPKDPMEALSIATSHGIDVLRMWSKHFPKTEVRRLAQHGLANAPVILNTAHATAPLPEEGLEAHNVPGHHVWTGSHEGLVALLDSRSDLWVQDPASSLAVSSVSDLAPEVVIDMCAGMGTKTRQLAATFPNAEIITTDVDLPRQATLREAFAGHPGRRVKVVEYTKLREHAGRADLVMLDVPCSNTGVLARRVEARYRFDRGRSEKLMSVQKQIIADAIPLLKAGGPGAGSGAGAGKRRGAILYSTCSLDPSENGDQVRWAAKWHMFKVTREKQTLPQGGPGKPVSAYTDGSYAALLQ